MMIKRIISLVLAPCLSISFNAAFANEVSRCTVITNSEQRLTCYDALFLSSPVSTAEAGPETVQEKPEDIQAIPNNPEQQPQVEQQIIEVHAATEPEIVAEAQEFGKEQVKPEPLTKEEQSSARRITARINKVSRRSRGEYVFTLQNDQVWVQTSPSWFKVKPGEQVIITKYRMGGYSLRNEGGASTRVRRVE